MVVAVNLLKTICKNINKVDSIVSLISFHTYVTLVVIFTTHKEPAKKPYSKFPLSLTS